MTPFAAKAKVWTRDDVEAFLPGRIGPIHSGFVYHAGLIAVAGSLVILQAAYLAMVGLAAYATLRYVLAIPAIVAETQLNFLTLVLISTPAVAGVVVTFFLLKPLLAKPPVPAKLISLDSSAEPVLFAFIERLCSNLGAPSPARIDVDLRVNASAGLRRGWRSLFSNDLVLTIGLPLVSGLDVQQFAAVLAHEFGHFSQHAGMRLYFLITTIRIWFIRVAYERDKWDAELESWRGKSGWRTKAIVSVAWATVQTSRYILRGLLYCANVVTAWFSRQMEFDADQHAAALAGGEAFAQALGLLPILDFSAQNAWQTINYSWKSQRLCDDFALLVSHRASALPTETRNQIIGHDAGQATGRWSTHPSKHDRTTRMKGKNGVSVFSGGSAEMLFSDFGALSRQATLHCYRQSLGDAVGRANITAARHFAELTDAETGRAQALEAYFGPVTMPARWFRLPDAAPPANNVNAWASLVDESTRYWSLLDESLHRYAALEFIRAGGRVNPAAFHLSSAEKSVVEAEERESRQELGREIARLRERFGDSRYLFMEAPDEWRDAYKAFSASQDDLLRLRYRLIAMRLVNGNARLLSAANAANSRDAHLKLVQEACATLLARFSGCQCPQLEPDDKLKTIAEQLRLSGSEDLTVEALAERILERADLLGAAFLGELCSRQNITSSAPTA